MGYTANMVEMYTHTILLGRAEGPLLRREHV